ncbi:MAG TPA: hypothetical protein VGX37_00325 [Allosphingosinicella sp.]|jgi:hypothetical protein|nr:hypothetical protein [Allosphingosinicella sp.]
MKRYYVAAGALLLGTSALALAADTKTTSSADVQATQATTDAKLSTDSKAFASTDKAMTATSASFATGTTKMPDPNWEQNIAAKTNLDSGSGSKLDFATIQKDVDRLASAETGTKLQVPSEEARAQFAASADSQPKVEAAAVDTDKLAVTVGDKTAETGMGGPLEEVDAGKTTTMTPQVATQNYPPCEPGPGDDRCIQLYEPGVRAQLASWNHETGGLMENSVTTAMGGPYEPVADKPSATLQTAQADSAKPILSADTSADDSWKPVYAESELAMNDSSTDSTKADTATADTSLASNDVSQHSEYSGVGGPVEAQSGYPPCSHAGPGEDRCIQLYEAGVTGSGN